MTYGSCSMSRPRAAISVATSTVALPSLKSASACSRSPWVRSLWIAVGVDAVAHEFAREAVGIALHAHEHQHLLHVARTDQVAQKRALACRRRLVNLVRDEIGRCVAARDFDQSSDCAAVACASLRISSGKRRREQQALPLRGSSARMRLMSGRKPMSSMRSASSSTRISTLREVHGLLLEVVEQAPGRRDQYLDAAVQRFRLRRRCPRRRRLRRAQRQVLAVCADAFLRPAPRARAWA